MNYELDRFIDNLLTIGESFRFSNDKIIDKEQTLIFNNWISESQKFLISYGYVERTKFEHPFYKQSQQHLFKVIEAYLTKIYLNNCGLL
ncbi:hypothetical protein BRE01_60480 [Brevibacillus reuszeri]|uniref:Uncharacterized protein n=1 Tax=Brevibacillus reuszeri TaxID=54915 RepID=A0A0K9YNB9_9BACL|nr:hypothetical protein [Brevibacillus reuszeri]KNB70209.1 hypothetical protein ADS79_14665 [Brevibacillus reuszeri]MED1859164.1 hypothetical protein [Brevibacillus reuszeri]GED72346.1 hypothetical protein BRE01_60480 [Brevibacillus reuszeri]